MASRPLLFVSLIASFTAGLSGACGGAKNGSDSTDAVDAADPLPPDACTVGLPCFVVDCAAKGLEPTSISGTVYAPNGTLPLYGVNVYVPLSDPGPLVEGVQCGNCASSLPGGAIAETVTDEAGHFTLKNVPATDAVPVIVQVGKWRRQFTVPTIAACQDTAVPVASTTLPKTKAEGDIPKIAITTGNADALECLVHKLGIADSEFTTDAGDGRVHLFAGNGTDTFSAGFAGGAGALPRSPTLWSTKEKLSNYDIAIFSCEGDQQSAQSPKPQSALQAVHDYADAGGRIFLSHWHNIWIGGDKDDPSHGLPDWKTIGTWDFAAPQDLDNNTATIDQTVPKGMSFAKWMLNVQGSTVEGEVPISGARYTLVDRDIAKADRRVHIPQAAPHQSVQDLEFSTPQAVAPEARCGKVVFSDMHVSSGSRSTASTSTNPNNLPTPFPTGCQAGDLSPQEKALAFLFFDISSCVGVIP